MLSNAMTLLPDGEYPFIDERLPLSEMAIVEAPADLEALFKEQAARNEVKILRDLAVELRCQSDTDDSQTNAPSASVCRTSSRRAGSS
jgi:hypothetical protein